jgi:2'-5' RNA ligase
VLQRFGSLTMVDVRRLMATLGTVIGAAAPLSLRFLGGAALEQRGDEGVWAKLHGDVDPLTTLVNEVNEAVRRIGFLVDRRSFKPQVRVATITDTTSVEYLQSVIDRLDGYGMAPWLTTEVALVAVHPTDTGGTRMEVVETFPLAGDPATPELSTPSHVAG